MSHADGENEKPSTTLPGTVQKIIKPLHRKAPEQAEITVDKAEELYREIRVENTLVNGKGRRLASSPERPLR